MKTLKDFKDEELAQWRATPITQAVIECLRSLRDEAEQSSLAMLRTGFTDSADKQSRFYAGIGEGVSKAIFFIERGGK